MIRLATECLIQLFKDEVLAHAVLVPPSEMFEVKRTPSLILQGPTLKENKARRTQARCITRDVPTLSYQSRRAPGLYHLDFDMVVTTAQTSALLDFQEKLARLFLSHKMIVVGDHGHLDLEEQTPLGGLKRPNLSNLRQSIGRCRIMDCPVFDGQVETGKLIRDRQFKFAGVGISETRHYQPGGILD